MKKTLIVVLCVLMVAVFAVSCTAETEPAPAPENEAVEEEVVEEEVAEEETPAAETYTIGYLAYDLSDVWNVESMNTFMYCADTVGWKVITQDAQNDAGAQVSQAESLINQGVDMITVFPASTESAQTIINMCNEAGVPVAVENIFYDDANAEIVGQIACQYADIGYAAIKFAAENYPGCKLLYVHGAPGLGVYEDYKIGVDQALKDFADSVEMVGLINGEWATEPSYNVTNDFITAGTAEFDVIFANNDLEAVGIYQALTEHDMADIPIISTGGSEEGYALFMDGVEAANMTAPVSIQGAQLFKFCYQHLTGAEIPETKIPLAVIPISQDNPDDWMHWTDYQAALDYIGGKSIKLKVW